MRAKRPFPLEQKRNHDWPGVKAKDTLRDDASHPHASLGPDEMKSTFADGGMIGEPVQQGNSVVSSSEATGGFAEGGKVKKNYKPGHNRNYTKGGEAEDFYRGRSRPKKGETARKELPMVNSRDGGKPKEAWVGMMDAESATKEFKKRARSKATRTHMKQHPDKKFRSDFLIGKDNLINRPYESKRKKAEHIEQIENDTRRKKKYPNQK